MSTLLKRIKGRSEKITTFSPLGTSVNYIDSYLSITRFYGGDDGVMIQLTINNAMETAYVQLTQKQVNKLRKVLKKAYK